MKNPANLLYLFLVAVSFAMNGQMLQAAETSECMKIHDDLNQRHAKIMASRKITAPAIREAMLLKLEDDLFVAIKICPKYSLMYALMGEVQLTIGQPSLAIAYGYRAQILDVTKWQGYFVAGTGYCLSGQYDNCFEQLNRSIEIAPDNYGLRLNLCSSQVWAGRYEAARRSCTGVIDNGPADLRAQAYYLRGRANEALGNKVAAKDDMAEASRLGFDPGQDILQVIDPKSVSDQNQ